MFYPAENDKTPSTDGQEDPQLILDGTANLEYADEESVPRVRGLIELFEQYLGSND